MIIPQKFFQIYSPKAYISGDFQSVFILNPMDGRKQLTRSNAFIGIPLEYDMEEEKDPQNTAESLDSDLEDQDLFEIVESLSGAVTESVEQLSLLGRQVVDVSVRLAKVEEQIKQWKSPFSP